MSDQRIQHKFSKERRSRAFEWVSGFSQTLRSITKPLTSHQSINIDRAVGYWELFLCYDGFIAVFYPDKRGSYDVRLEHSSSAMRSEFIHSNSYMKCLELEKNRDIRLPTTWFGVDENRKHSCYLMFDETVKYVCSGFITRPLTSILCFIGWDTETENPVSKALEYLETINVVNSLNEPRRNIEEFWTTLEGACSEADMQRFFEKYPKLMLPDAVYTIPKFPLGKEWRTDFLCVRQSLSGQIVTLVEIEDPSKPIFTRKDDFSHHFTQASGQIGQWKVWCTENINYLRRDIERKGFEVYRPTFRLIMGRSKELVGNRRALIKERFNVPDVDFATYDDVFEHAQALVRNLSSD